MFLTGSLGLYISLYRGIASGGTMSGSGNRDAGSLAGNLEGGCACRAIRYRLTAPPMIVHACHCRDCQKQTGSAFVLNLWIERDRVAASGDAPVPFRVPPGGSGQPHDVFRCAKCGTALWSKYHAAPGDTVLLRAGTLDDPARITPDVHIFTRSKVPWLTLPAGAAAFDGFYKIDEVWPPESLARWRALTTRG